MVTFLPMASGYASLMGHHRQLLDDRVRTDAFTRAIAATVKPGDVVLDLGTGTGVLAFAARRAGARLVYAIDHDPIVHVAAAVARDNRIDGIQFIEVGSRAWVHAPIDVIVSECFGPFAIGGSMIRAVTEVRDRALVAGGRVIPGSVALVVAPVDDPAIGDYVAAFARPRDGLAWTSAHRLAVNNVYTATVSARSLLARGGTIATIDLRRDDHRGSTSGTARLATTRSGTCHAIAGWFVADLAGEPGSKSERVTLSTAPGRPTTIWQQVVFPLPAPVRVAKGTPITIAIACHNGEHFDWSGTIGDREFRSSTRYSHPSALAARVPLADSSVAGENKLTIASDASRARSSGEP